jgi:hypothetical protein
VARQGKHDWGRYITRRCYCRIGRWAPAALAWRLALRVSKLGLQ